jgi:hypothetical protein
MQTHLRRLAVIAALTIGASACSAIPAMAQDQEHRDSTMQNQREHTDNAANHPDYSNNRYYRLGNQEGAQDHKRNKQRTSHNHAYKSDDDRKAHDYGYQQGWQGSNNRDNHENHEDPH